MPRALKVFKTHLGFYDLIVAAPSMKAAAEAWQVHPRIFTQGFAAQTNEPDAVKAALEHPGMVLRRPHGQTGEYKAQADRPAPPKLTAGEKRKAAKAARHHQAEKKKAAKDAARKKAEADKRAKAAAEDELAEIEREEAKLRERRRALQKQFHLRSIS